MRVTDAADGCKPADQPGRDQQVSVAHVVRNTEAWAERMGPDLERDRDGSLAAIGGDAARAGADVAALCRLMRERDPTVAAARQVRAIHRRYREARGPRRAQTQSMRLADRLRLFGLDRWYLWNRLPRDRTWKGPAGAVLDGTNNAPSGRSAGGSRSATVPCAGTTSRCRAPPSAT